MVARKRGRVTGRAKGTHLTMLFCLREFLQKKGMPYKVSLQPV